MIRTMEKINEIKMRTLKSIAILPHFALFVIFLIFLIFYIVKIQIVTSKNFIFEPKAKIKKSLVLSDAI